MEDAPELFVTPESEQSEAVAVAGNVQALLDLMARNPLHREIYLQIIEFCEVRRLLGDVEAMVADCSGFSLTAQTPFRLIANVVDNGGIHWYEVDAQGDEITEERRANLTDDEADDLVEGFALEASDAGREVLERMAPERRLRDLFDKAPGRLSTYLVHQPDAGALIGASGQPLQPSYFVDMLERSGGLVWDKGWKATGKGSALAKQLRPALAV